MKDCDPEGHMIICCNNTLLQFRLRAIKADLSSAKYKIRVGLELIICEAHHTQLGGLFRLHSEVHK